MVQLPRRVIIPNNLPAIPSLHVTKNGSQRSELRKKMIPVDRRSVGVKYSHLLPVSIKERLALSG